MQQDVLFNQPIIDYVWNEKYRFKHQDGSSDEKTISDSHLRVASYVFKNDVQSAHYIPLVHDAMVAGDFAPAGRVHAGAGTGRRVTLINCFVSNTVLDSMRSNSDGVGIMDSLRNSSLTMQMGGGIGIDFSPIRPSGAEVKGVGSIASGPLDFMDMWNAMCKTIMSSGSRRGAMMATMICHHPDIMKFITAKRKKGRLKNFNLSVMITDDFIKAVHDDLPWDLWFGVQPADPSKRLVVRKNGHDVYLYKTMNARVLWDQIREHTYKYSEPGIIFIDRINTTNNLYYCEDIRCVNPCGEQPLPPNGDCNLSAINLAVMVDDPFGSNPEFDYGRLERSTELGVRFLDNVLDVTHYPTELQEDEALSKRRIGLGITGLGNMLQQMKIKYGSDKAVALTKEIMKTLCYKAYETSIELAVERGPFLLFDKERYLDAYFIKKLPKTIRRGISKHGIRNAVLLTIAPTGTTSLYYGNVSSGLEPTFAFTGKRNVLMPDNSYKEFTVEDYSYKLYCDKVLDGNKSNGVGLPDYMVTAQELSVHEHLIMQAACQEYIDSSISKTINCPTDISFDNFKDVYSKAYELGLKGCTTYRFNPDDDVRGSILSSDSEKTKLKSKEVIVKTLRPEVLEGKTYKVKWPGKYESNYYITITNTLNDEDVNIPLEVFISTKDVRNAEWITGLCRTISAVLRRGGDVRFLCDELQQVYSPIGGQWIQGKYIPSLVAMIGYVLQRHMISIGYMNENEIITPIEQVKTEEVIIEEVAGGKIKDTIGDMCPNCHEWSLIASEGCSKCVACGYSDCE